MMMSTYALNGFFGVDAHQGVNDWLSGGSVGCDCGCASAHLTEEVSDACREACRPERYDMDLDDERKLRSALRKLKSALRGLVQDARSDEGAASSLLAVLTEGSPIPGKYFPTSEES
jgi:hypothetical protein